jgi:DNA-nicking Smr family endonuclease
MARKKKPQRVKNIEFVSSPFNSLTGFAVSAPVPSQEVTPPAPVVEGQAELHSSFVEEMAFLDVKRLNPSAADEEEDFLESRSSQNKPLQVAEPQDEEEFLQALGELEVRFSDQFPDADRSPAASARRMKQLKQGKLTPQASLDLHGLLRTAVAGKMRFFLQKAQHQGWSTLLVITGKGLHSEGGEPVLRQEAELFLAGEGHKWVAEWGRASKQYGGDGALVLFLRKRPC